MGFLNRDQILGAKDMETRDVAVPEWGGTVRIRMLSGKERDAFEASTVEMKKDGTQKRNADNLRARLVGLCIIQADGPEAGRRMFVDAEIKLLGEKSAKALQRVFNACQELNAVSDEDVEALAEGFDDAPSESSTSD